MPQTTPGRLVLFGAVVAVIALSLNPPAKRPVGQSLPPELAAAADEGGDIPADVLRRFVADRPAEDRPALVRQVAGTPNGKDTARGVLMAAMDLDPETAEPVLAAYLESFPEPHWGPLWAIKLKTRQKHFDEAVRLFRERSADVANDDSERRGALYSFLEYMTEAGRPVDGYREAGDRDADYAFRVVAEFLDGHAGLTPPAAADRLRELVAAHRGRAGETPWTTYYAGVASELAGDDEKAQAAYADASRRLAAAGLGQTPLQKAGILSNAEDRTWDHARSRRVQCLWRLGRWEQAYDECEPPAATFNQLTQLFEIQKDWDGLSRLVARHRARVPGDPLADLWEAVAHFGRGEYEQAVAGVDRYLPTVRSRERQDHRAFRVKFRSQVRLGRLEDARRTYEAEARFTPPRVERVLLDAKAGDVGAVERALAEAAQVSTDPFRDYYADEDLGPLLRSARFAGVRARYQAPAGLE